MRGIVRRIISLLCRAGGNAGAVAAGFLFKGALDWPAALRLGFLVTLSSALALAVRFAPQAEREATAELQPAVGPGRHPGVTLELAVV